MALIEPVSSLSIKKAVNLYTIILFLSFAVLLYWLATDRYQDFVHSHENTANNATKIVAFQINKILIEKQREIDIFVEDSKAILANLSDRPDNENINQKLINRLKKYQPDFLELNIMSTTGRTILGNFNSNNDELCLEDFNYYINNNKQQIRLHPGKNGYHYDIISRYSTNKTDPVFVISFRVNEISDLLNSTQSQKHNLILVNKGTSNSIGLTSEGDIKKIKDGLNFKISNGINLSTISKNKVKNTSWYVVDMANADLFDDYKTKIMKEFLIAFYIFAMIVIFMRYILLKQDAKRSIAEEQLKKNHDQIKVLNNSLDQLSKRDALTGLYNRRYFDEMINHEWNRGLRSKETLSCILLDIDHFKNYNDYYGHQAGDKCIKDIAKLLKNTFERESDMVARYGGEEFIVAMTVNSEKEAKAAIIKFQLALKRLKIPHQASETDKFVTTSAGLAVLTPSKNVSVDYFIRYADKALYQAKENGRNQFVVHEEEKISQWAYRI